ncbi:MAG TPA: substrate-binding domain-containing protein [Candidatus Binatia bacterium]
MNTKEVADYLGINEKQVYHLANVGKIPGTRVTGKWVFPKKLIDEWIEESSRGALKRKGPDEQGLILGAGSDDPSLGVLRDLYATSRTPSLLFIATVGSSAGLAAIRDGAADFAFSHLLDPGGGNYNFTFIEKIIPSGAAVVSLFRRELGLVVPAGNPLGVRALANLARSDVRMINRQAGSGTRHYLDQQFAILGVEPKNIKGYDDVVLTHLEVGSKILRQEADAGIATRTAARLLGLDFIPLTAERFDIVVGKQRFFSPAIKTLLDTVVSREFRNRVNAMGGYDTSDTGRVVASI